MSIIKVDLNNTYLGEYVEYNRLFLLGSSRTSSGNPTFTSTSSSQTYTVSDNGGENSMLGLLKTALDPYMITAANYNSITSGSYNYISATPTSANVYSTTPTLGLLAYNEGLTIKVKFSSSNTGASTLNIDSLGADDLKKNTTSGKSALQTGDIIENCIYDVVHDGTDWILITVNNNSGYDVGEIKYFAMNTAPIGYLKANGAAISRTTYSDLFTAIGTTFGSGDGSTTFNLPDLRGVFPRGWDDSRGYDTGRTFGSYQADDNKAHTHTGTTASDGVHTHSVTYPPLNYAAGGLSQTQLQTVSNPGTTGSGNSFATTDSQGAHTHTLTTDSTGATEVKVKNVALLACIKY
jgi:microcystin-dependent protein